MKQRDAGSAPALGDRVAYVIIKGLKGSSSLRNYHLEGFEFHLFHVFFKVPLRTRSQKTLSMSWKIIFLSIQSITSITNSRTPLWGSLSQSWEKRLPHFVCPCLLEQLFFQMLSCYSIRGSHTDDPDCHSYSWRFDEVRREDCHLSRLQNPNASQ